MTLTRCAALAALALLPMLAGCQTAAAPEAPAESPRQIKFNPNPQQVVRVHGRVPPSVAVEFMAEYGLTEEAFKDPKCEPRRYQGQIPVFFDFVRYEPVAITRSGDKYEAKLVIDFAQPSVCPWEFKGLHASLAKDGKWDDKLLSTAMSTDPISPDFKGSGGECDDDTSTKSTRSNKSDPSDWLTTTSDCRAVANSDPTPVWVRCHMLHLKGDPKPPSFYCGSHDRHKRRHLITPTTRDVQMDIYDLTVDADPYQPPPESKP